MYLIKENTSDVYTTNCICTTGRIKLNVCNRIKFYGPFDKKKVENEN